MEQRENLSSPRFETLYIFARKKKNDLELSPETEIQQKEDNFATDAMKENSR